MVRKRDAWTRMRDRRHRRPKTPAPTSGWLLAEIAELTGLSLTTLRYYLKQRIVQPIELRGTSTRYQRTDLLRLLGIMRLKLEGKSTLAEKQRRLDSMSAGQLEAWLCSGPLVPAAAAALGLQAPAKSAASDSVSMSAMSTTSTSLGKSPNEFWQRTTLLPGLELMLRVDAPEAARSAAQRICEEYGVK